jgi:hypothetical protein
VGRTVAVLANLEPRAIRRITSQGIVLAADLDGTAALVEIPEEVAPGQVIAGAERGSRTIAYADFERTPLIVGRLVADGSGELTAEIGGRTVAVHATGAAGRSVVIRLTGPDATDGSVLGFDADHNLGLPAAARPGAKVR